MFKLDGIIDFGNVKIERHSVVHQENAFFDAGEFKLAGLGVNELGLLCTLDLLQAHSLVHGGQVKQVRTEEVINLGRTAAL